MKRLSWATPAARIIHGGVGSIASFSTSKFAVPKPWVAVAERSEPPEIPPTGGSLRSTPAIPRSNLEVLSLHLLDRRDLLQEPER